MNAELLAVLTPRVSVLALALVLDVGLGEPPAAIHPVVLCGRVISALTRPLLARPAWRQLCGGAAVALALPACCAVASALLLDLLAPVALLQLCVEAWLLKSCFAVRALLRAGGDVASALHTGRLEHARAGLRSLCSRDPSGLDATHVAAAAVESLAENASDSIVAPLFYYACFGLPGAVCYRVVNTLDAMIGYHGAYEYIGKVAARCDDVLNLVPARLTATLVLIAGCLCGRDPRGGVRVLLRDGAATESPNAGRPMAAMAGMLRVALDKPGHYRLGDGGAAVDAGAIQNAARIVLYCAGLAALASAVAIGVRHGFRG